MFTTNFLAYKAIAAKRLESFDRTSIVDLDFRSVLSDISINGLKYSSNLELEVLIQLAILKIESGTAYNHVQKVIKKTSTDVLLADAGHAEARFRPGATLTTYTGVDTDGNPIKETYGGGVAQIKEGSVILRYPHSLTYPKGHKLEGQAVRGYFNDANEFIISPDGDTELHNEYASDVAFVHGAYGITATVTWQSGFKLLPGFALQIPADTGTVIIKTASGVEINVKDDDFVIIDTKKGKVSSVHAIAQDWFERTYGDYEAYVSSLPK